MRVANMKKILIILVAISFLLTGKTYADIDMSVYGGISTPSDDMNEVYKNNEDVWDFVGKGIDVGWHLGARIRLESDTGLFFFIGMGWHRFSDVQLEVIKENSDTTYQIKARHDILPIGVGVQYYITKKTVKLYVIGQLNYNHFTTHGEFIGLPAPNFDLSDAVGRGGFQVGTGVAFNLVLVEPFLELSYSMPNLIGKSTDEPLKQFFNFSLGINL
jgi:hypothetical protein